MFFFGSYEGYKSEQSLVTLFNVPNDALRNGDFSGALNANGTQQIIYDPLDRECRMAAGACRSRAT